MPFTVLMCAFAATASTPLPKVPQQLNSSGFAACLASQTGGNLPNLAATKATWNLTGSDGLLVYLSLYAGKRLPLLNSTVQQPAYERWGVRFETEGEKVAGWLNKTVKSANSSLLTPAQLFRQAVVACGGSEETSQMCAFIVMHNVLRTLGRNNTFIDKSGTNFLPKWWKRDAAAWIKAKAAIQSHLISLRRDGGGDRWGAWYHNAGLLAYGLHEAAILGRDAGTAVARAVAILNRVLNPIFAGGKEDPVKARIDLDSAQTVQLYLDRNFSISSTLDCGAKHTFVL